MNLNDHRIRLAAFRYLEEQVAIHGDVLPYAAFGSGFNFQGRKVKLVAPKGIHKPVGMALPLTFKTIPPDEKQPAPYHDTVGSDGLIRYCYRGTDPSHPDNVGLRECMKQRIPLIYLFGVVKGRYLPVFPAYIVGDDPRALRFSVQADDAGLIGHDLQEPEEAAAARRCYVTTQVQRRLHQRSFRDRVLRAYRSHCAVCRLRHEELLEAAHIIPDRDPRGVPEVRNGLSLCQLHHGAFDAKILGIRPDLIIQIRHDILAERDGPMLRHGLQGFDGKKLAVVPKAAELRPDPDYLDERYAAFLAAS
jgi:putative restriction endonuclease